MPPGGEAGRHYTTGPFPAPRCVTLNESSPKVGASGTELVPDALIHFVADIRAAKLGAAGMYASVAEQMSSVDANLALRRLVEEETEHAAALAAILGMSTPESPRVAAGVGCGLHDEGWPSALMAAFALDQAATASLLAVAQLEESPLRQVAERIAEDERGHQAFALAAFKSVAHRDAAAGRRLAADMLEARDWVKAVFPRHSVLVDLAAGGMLPPTAAKVHDSFLASLGDRIQEALGVLGD